MEPCCRSQSHHWRRGPYKRWATGELALRHSAISLRQSRLAPVFAWRHACIEQHEALVRSMSDALRQPFIDRREAGAVLAQQLRHYAYRSDAIVLALPRGGVPIGYEVATLLGL